MIRKRPRAWICQHCKLQKNLALAKKCVRCGIRRATKRTSLKSRCDRMAAQIVKARAGGKCERCHAVAPLDWAHIFARRFHSTRWDPENAMALCRPCHRYFTDHPASWTAYLMDWKGKDWVLDMERRSNEAWDRDYAKVLAELDKDA